MKKVEDKKYEFRSIPEETSKKDFEKLKSLLENNEINYFTFEMNNDDFDEKILQMLEEYPNILELMIVPLNRKSLVVPSSLLRNKNLPSLFLDLERNDQELDDFSRESIFELLLNNKSIESLTIYGNLQGTEFEYLQKIVNSNPNLKSLSVKSFSYYGDFNEVTDIFNQFYDGLNINHSLISFELCQKQLLIKDFTFLQKFPKLKSLNLECKDLQMADILNSITRDTNPYLDSVEFSIKEPQIGELNFSKTSITKFYFSGPKIEYISIRKIMRSLKELEFIESLNISYRIDIEERNKYPFFQWIKDLKEILIKNQKLKELNISGNYINQAEFKFLNEGLLKNDSLTYLDIETSEPGKYTKELGCILKTKKNLKKLLFGGKNLYDFLSEIHSLENLEDVSISNCIINEEEGKLLGKMIKNNRNLFHFSLDDFEIDEDSVKFIFEPIVTHPSIKKLNLDSNNLIPLNYHLDLIEKSLIIEKYLFSPAIFEHDPFEEFCKALSKNTNLKILNVNAKGDLPENYEKIFHENLIFNFNLLEFNLGNLESPYYERNIGFIKNYYQFPKITTDIIFNFQ